MVKIRRSGCLPLDEGYGSFRPGSPAIRPDRILRLQGYKDLTKVRAQICITAEAMALRAERLIDAEVHYRTTPIIERDGERLVLEGGITFTNQAFRRFLPGADRVIALIVTLGSGIDQDVIGMIDRFEPLEALLLETAGWLGIEWATKAFHDHLRRSADASGYRVSLRMAPGYSYRLDSDTVSWPLEQQRELFQLFAGHPLPVTLLESCAMTPKMSRSGLYGLFWQGDRQRQGADDDLLHRRLREENLGTRADSRRFVASPIGSQNSRGVVEV